MKLAFLKGLISAGLLTASQTHVAQAQASASDVYAAYDWLIGDWSAKSGLREVISYGPNRGYIRFSTFIPGLDGAEHLHFEGIAVWNGRTKTLDYLFAVEPGSGGQESGTYRIDRDGTIIREVELIDAKGFGGTFRQTFRRTGPSTAITAVMRKTKAGWEPTFPGGDRIELERKSRPAAG